MSWLTDIFWARKVCYESRLPASDFLRELQLRLSAPAMFGGTGWGQLFSGEVIEQHFRLRRHGGYKNTLSPIVGGKVAETADDKSKVYATLRIHPFILVLLGAFFALFISVACLFIYYSKMDEISDWLMVFPLVFILLILVLVLLMVQAEISRIDEDLAKFFRALDNF